MAASRPIKIRNKLIEINRTWAFLLFSYNSNKEGKNPSTIGKTNERMSFTKELHFHTMGAM